MSVRRALGRALSVLALVLVLSTVLGAVLGQPVGLTYVETGSMEPTLSPGDGFVAVPSALSGPVEEGDIVVFDAVNINDGGLVTHRVVGETERGFITRGDANPVTDQDGSEPPVQSAQITATALTVGGSPVVVPFVGTVVEGVGGSVGWVQRRLAALFGTRALLGTQGLSYVLVGFGVVTYLLSAVFEGSGDRDTRRRTRRSTGVLNFRTIVVVMLVALVAILTLSMALPAGTQSFQFVSSETDAPGPSVIPQGGSETVTYNVPSNGQVPVVSIVEPASDGVSLNRSVLFVPGGGVQRVTVTLEAPAETGAYNRIVVEHRYLAFLPVGVIVFLHGLHPWLPVVAINAVAGTLFVALAVVLVGTDPIRIERGKRDVPLSIRLRRWLD